MRCEPRSAVLAATILLLASGSAQAQAPSTDERSLLLEGNGMLTAHRDEDALSLFRRAHEIAGSPRSLAQIGIAEGALGRWLDADEHLRGALGRADDPWIRKNAAALDQALTQVDSHLGELQIQCNVVGATVRVDDRASGTVPLPAPLRLVVGTATLAVSAPGYLTIRRPVQILAATRNREVVDLQLLAGDKLSSVAPVPAASPAPSMAARDPATGRPDAEVSKVATSPVTAPSTRTSRRAIWAAVGVLAGVVVVGGVTAGVVLGVPANASDPAADLGTQGVKF